MEQNPENSNETNNANVISRNLKFSLFTFFSILLVLLLFGVIYLIYQNSQISNLSNTNSKDIILDTTPVPTIQDTQPAPQSTEKMLDKAELGSFSYGYPRGWHVTEILNDAQGKNRILMDPEPVYLADRGGPLATFEFEFIYGSQDKEIDELLEQEKKEFINYHSADYSNLKQETINSNNEPIYYYSADFGEGMFSGSSIERYYFILNRDPSNRLDEKLLIGTLIRDKNSSQSELFREVVLSFKSK